jgi:hypothetical protein
MTCSVCRRPYERPRLDSGMCVPCEIVQEKERVAQIKKAARIKKFNEREKK